MREVTDPELLKQLNGTSELKEVTDPTLLSQLNGQKLDFNSPEALAQRQADLKRTAGLGVRSALQGISAPVALGSDLLGLGVNTLAGKEVIPSLSGMVKDTLTNIGLPEPQTTGERMISDVISGAMGGGSVAKGYLPMLAGGAAGGGAGLAREMGASPLTQLITGLGSGAAAGGIGGALKSLTTKPTGTVAPILGNLEKQGIDELSSFNEVRNNLQNEAANHQNRINQLFTNAKESGDKAFLPQDQLSSLAKSLREKANNEIDADSKGIYVETAKKIDKLAGQKGQDTGILDINGEPISTPLYPTVNNLETIRRAATKVAKTGGSKGYAGGDITREIDSFLENNIDNAVGDKGAISNWKEAIQSRREYGQKFEQPKEIAFALSDKSPEAVEQKFIGSGGASLNKQLSTTYKNTLNALPEDQRDQGGFLLRQSIVNRMVKNAAQSSDSQDGISAQRLSNQIRNFKRDNQSMWNNFTPDEQGVLNNLESDLRDVSQGGVLNTVAKHLFSFLGKASKSNLELPRTLKPKSIITVDDLLELTKVKPEGFNSSISKGISNPGSIGGVNNALYQDEKK